MNRKKPTMSTSSKKTSLEEVKQLSPDDLPLSDTWYHMDDLITMFKVKRPTIDRYRLMGILRHHKWGGTLRFNKTYVDWMIKNGGRKLSCIVWLLSTWNWEW